MPVDGLQNDSEPEAHECLLECYNIGPHVGNELHGSKLLVELDRAIEANDADALSTESCGLECGANLGLAGDENARHCFLHRPMRGRWVL